MCFDDGNCVAVLLRRATRNAGAGTKDLAVTDFTYDSVANFFNAILWYVSLICTARSNNGPKQIWGIFRGDYFRR